MALKVGEKEVGTSIASLSQRRGVTPAYTGDALATAAENIGSAVNTFQARAAELLDLEYRTKANADATKRITELSRDENYRYDPDKFMAAANAYLEKAVKEAPTRYKAWTKQLITPLIATKGDALWTKWNSRYQEERKKEFAEDHMVVLNNIGLEMQDMNFAQLDEYVVGPDGKGGIVLQRLAESYENYTKLYNSVDDNTGMIRPEEWYRQQQVYVEELRMQNVVSSILTDALKIDAENSINNPLALNFRKEDLVFEQAAKNVQKILNQYLDNPEKIDGIPQFASLLKDTTFIERDQIVENLKAEVAKYQNDSDQAYNLYKIKQKVNANVYIDSIEQRIDGFDSQFLSKTSDNELINTLYSLEVPEQDIINIVNKKNANKLINDEVKSFSDRMKTTNLHNLSIVLTNKLIGDGNETYNNAEEVQQAIVDSMFNQAIRPPQTKVYREEIAPQLGLGQTVEEDVTPYFDATTIDFFEYNSDGTLKYGDALDRVNEIVNTTNRVPTAIMDAFGQREYLKTHTIEDFQRAIELGRLANNLVDKEFPPSNLDEKTILELNAWSKFYEEYNEIEFPDEKGFNEKKEHLQKVLLSTLNPSSQSFYSATNTWVDANLSFNTNVEEEGQINVAKLFSYYVKEEIETRPKNHLIPFWYDIFSSEKLTESDLNAIASEVEIPFKTIIANDIAAHYNHNDISTSRIDPQELAVPSSFLDENYLLKVFKQAIQMKGVKEWSIFE